MTCILCERAQAGIRAQSPVLPQYSGLAAPQAVQPVAGRLGSSSKLQRSEFSGTSGDPLAALPPRATEHRAAANANGSDGNRCTEPPPVPFSRVCPESHSWEGEVGGMQVRCVSFAALPEKILRRLIFYWTMVQCLLAGGQHCHDGGRGPVAGRHWGHIPPGTN